MYTGFEFGQNDLRVFLHYFLDIKKLLCMLLKTWKAKIHKIKTSILPLFKSIIEIFVFHSILKNKCSTSLNIHIY